MLRNIAFDTDDIQAKDNKWLHPWEDVGKIDRQKRTVMVRGEGVYVFDSEGNRLIDGPAGMWCVNIGHGRAEMAEAIAEQVRELTYYSPWSMATSPASELAAKLTEIAPEGFNHVFFTTGGSTAVDSALRFVAFLNNLTGRPEKKHLISRIGAYHGSTYLSGSVSGKMVEKKFMDNAEDFVHFLPNVNPYRRPEGMSEAEFRDAKVQDLEDKILELGADKVAAFIAEPILASGGVIVPPDGYHAKCAEVCRRHDVLYISDEVVTGFGRLGHFFATQDEFGVDADIITSAKGLTSGYQPLGAVLIHDRLISRLTAEQAKETYFFSGFTYSGHPVACAAALKNIEIIERENLLENAREVGAHLQARMRELSALPVVGNVRGKGLMVAVEFITAKQGTVATELDNEVCARVDRHCQRLGLVARPVYNASVMSPPLTITKAQVDDIVRIMGEAIALSMQELRDEGLWDG